MTTRHRAIRWRCAGLGFVGKRLFLHIAKIGHPGCMAGFAPTSAVAKTGVVVHGDRSPRSRAVVARLAVHRTAIEQLRLRNVVARFARGIHAVVATGTVGCRGKCAVIGLGAQPCGGGFMAGFAGRRRGDVARGLARCVGAIVATGTAGTQHDILVNLGRRPAGIALVAGNAIGGSHDVIASLAGCTAAVVATGAIGGRRERAVVGLGARPAAGGLVAALACRRGGKVTAVLAGRHRAVVAARTTRAHRNRNSGQNSPRSF